MDVYKMIGKCDWCGEEDTELYDLGGANVCSNCVDDDAASMIISDDIDPTLDEF